MSEQPKTGLEDRRERLRMELRPALLIARRQMEGEESDFYTMSGTARIERYGSRTHFNPDASFTSDIVDDIWHELRAEDIGVSIRELIREMGLDEGVVGVSLSTDSESLQTAFDRYVPAIRQKSWVDDIELGIVGENCFVGREVRITGGKVRIGLKLTE